MVGPCRIGVDVAAPVISAIRPGPMRIGTRRPPRRRPVILPLRHDLKPMRPSPTMALKASAPSDRCLNLPAVYCNTKDPSLNTRIVREELRSPYGRETYIRTWRDSRGPETNHPILSHEGTSAAQILHKFVTECHSDRLPANSSTGRNQLPCQGPVNVLQLNWSWRLSKFSP
jgi:hypothetical protein